MEPKMLTSQADREMARRSLEYNWRFMERVAEHGVLWVCPWNKDGRESAPDELRLCLLSGVELSQWIGQHKDWFVVGEWDDAHYANPVQLTPAGIQAMSEREKYDTEPIMGGLVEPGWQAIPAESR